MGLFTMYPQPWTLEEFLERFARPYDPLTDDYVDPGPFASNIAVGKNSAIYNAHSYHTKVPPQGIVPYILHYTRPGDLVLDPFCGSGMTGVACGLCADPPPGTLVPSGAELGLRPVILNDLSPAACHIAYNYTHPVDPAALEEAWRGIRDAVADEFEWLYGTRHDDGKPATIQYTIWSDVYECPRCAFELVLWDVAVDPDSGAVRNEFECPECHMRLRKTDCGLLRVEPVVVNYTYRGDGRGRRAERRINEDERRRIADIEAAEIPYWYPTVPFGPDREMWRGVHQDHGITSVDRFYTKRSLWALARLWHETLAFPEDMQAALRFGVTAIVMTASLMYAYRDTRKGGIQKGTLYVPALTCELNALEAADRKLAAQVGTRGQAARGRGSPVCVLCGSADTLGLASQSIDYVFTDPPFGSNIFYADCSFLWEAWLGEFTDETHEAVVHVKHKHKNTLDDYRRIMAASFREMHRVLKPGRYASVVFHNSDDAVWHVIQETALEAGFEIANALVFDKQQRSFKGIKGEKGEEDVHNVDIVLNLRKPRAAGPNGQTRVTPEIEDLALDVISEHLQTGPAPEQRTTQFLRTAVIQQFLKRGIRIANLSMPHLERLLTESGLRRVDLAWYLPEEEVAVPTADGRLAIDDVPAAAVTDERSAIAWLRTVLTERPLRRGDLIVEWQRATVGLVGQELDLERLLEDNFTQLRDGRWRPMTAEERRSRGTLQDRRRLRRIRQYLEGTLSEQDVTPARVCEWVAFCYEHQFDNEAVHLFARLTEDEVAPEEYEAARQRARACRARLER